MSLKIVIDGYNLMHVSLNLQLLAAKDLEAARNRLLSRLEQYRTLSHHRLTVVFDGWRSGAPMESHDRLGQVDIIYSRLGEKADEVIKRLAQAGGQGTMVVVTSDRELANFVQNCGATVITSAQFDARLRAKSQATEIPPDKDEEEYPPASGKKKGTAHRLSRKDRRLKTTLQKL